MNREMVNINTSIAGASMGVGLAGSMCAEPNQSWSVASSSRAEGLGKGILILPQRDSNPSTALNANSAADPMVRQTRVSRSSRAGASRGCVLPRCA